MTMILLNSIILVCSKFKEVVIFILKALSIGSTAVVAAMVPASTEQKLTKKSMLNNKRGKKKNQIKYYIYIIEFSMLACVDLCRAVQFYCK